MSKIGIIIKREYLRRVSKLSFLLITFFTPFLIAGLLFVPLWLSTIKGDSVKDVAVLDATGLYSPLFTDTEEFRFLIFKQTIEEFRENPPEEVFAVIRITDNLLTDPKAGAIYSEKQIPVELSRLVNHTLREKIQRDKLDTYNIPNLREIIDESRISYSIQTIKWGQDGSEQISSSQIAGVIGMVFTFIVYLFIVAYGAMVMQGVMEEKTNRIVELIISSVKPFELMMGKIIGILFVGLTQVFLWGILTSCLLLIGGVFSMGSPPDPAALQQAVELSGSGELNDVISAEASEIMQILSTINFIEILIFFILYFVGGYLLYASIFAAIGSAVDQQEDTQQFMTPVMLFMAFAFYAGIYSMQNPDGPLAFWCSMIPFTSPVVMMIRLPFEIPMWEKLLSVVLLYLTSVSIVWVSAKIYRVGILMYGKKPSVKEIVKWIKYQ